MHRRSLAIVVLFSAVLGAACPARAVEKEFKFTGISGRDCAGFAASDFRVRVLRVEDTSGGNCHFTLKAGSTRGSGKKADGSWPKDNEQVSFKADVKDVQGCESTARVTIQCRATKCIDGQFVTCVGETTINVDDETLTYDDINIEKFGQVEGGTCSSAPAGSWLSLGLMLAGIVGLGTVLARRFGAF